MPSTYRLNAPTRPVHTATWIYSGKVAQLTQAISEVEGYERKVDAFQTLNNTSKITSNTRKLETARDTYQRLRTEFEEADRKKTTLPGIIQQLAIDITGIKDREPPLATLFTDHERAELMLARAKADVKSTEEAYRNSLARDRTTLDEAQIAAREGSQEAETAVTRAKAALDARLVELRAREAEKEGHERALRRAQSDFSQTLEQWDQRRRERS